MVEAAGILILVQESIFDWFKIFLAPFQNLEMLWIIAPIWSIWLFSEFFQEKKGTSFGNAITNGAVMLFVGVDWIRNIMREITAGGALGPEEYIKLAISVAIIILSFFIIAMGIKAHSFIKYVGRVRESTYLMLMFSPIIYGVVEFNLRTFLVILAFFPVFYILIEILDRLIPTPKAFKSPGSDFSKDTGLGDLGNLGKDSGLGNLNSDFGKDISGSSGFSQPPPSQPQQPFPPNQNRKF
jgi:hypothetical protein